MVRLCTHRFVVVCNILWNIWLGYDHVEDNDAVVCKLLKPIFHTGLYEGDYLRKLAAVDLVNIMFAAENSQILPYPVKDKGLAEVPAIGADKSN